MALCQTKRPLVPAERDPEFDLRQIRKEIVQYCSGLPDLIRADAVSDDLASMALALGKCFCWIHHRLDAYERQIWEADRCQDTVGTIGKRLWNWASSFARNEATNRRWN